MYLGVNDTKMKQIRQLTDKRTVLHRMRNEASAKVKLSVIYLFLLKPEKVGHPAVN